jgi:drug/metabolite transporter (DMT)-like permease
MALLGALLYGLSLNLTIAAYRLGELTALGPLASLSVIWTILLAIRFLGEVMTPLRWFGAGLIVAGSVVITT